MQKLLFGMLDFKGLSHNNLVALSQNSVVLTNYQDRLVQALVQVL